MAGSPGEVTVPSLPATPEDPTVVCITGVPSVEARGTFWLGGESPAAEGHAGLLWGYSGDQTSPPLVPVQIVQPLRRTNRTLVHLTGDLFLYLHWSLPQFLGGGGLLLGTSSEKSNCSFMGPFLDEHVGYWPLPSEDLGLWPLQPAEGPPRQCPQGQRCPQGWLGPQEGL